MSQNTSVPLSTSAFLSGIGVDTHLAYTDGGYANIAKVISDLKALGISTVRDGITNGFDANGNFNGSAPLSSYIALAQAGIKFTFIIEPLSQSYINAQLALINQVSAAVPGSVIAIEGANEINNQPLTFNGVGGIDGAVAAQRALYAAVKADTALAGVSVDYFTGYGAGGLPLGPDPSTTAGLSDYDTQHPYPNYGQAPAAWVSRAQALPNVANPQTAPAVYTETGYSSNTVNLDVQAKYQLDLLLDTAKQNISETYLYELMDAYSPGSRQGDQGWGQFDSTGAAKPVATAIHNLTTLMQDNGAQAASFAPTALNYSVSGLNSTGNSLLLEKSDGSYVLAVWAEPQIWNAQSSTETAAVQQSVTVTLPQSFGSINVFDPLAGTNAINSYSNQSSVTISVTDHPILITLSQPQAADTLVLNLSEDAYQGDAQFVVTVDGKQVGGTQTVTALHSAQNSQNFTFTGNFGSGSHVVGVDYTNDAWGGTSTTDRNLYVNSITLDGAKTTENSKQTQTGLKSYTVGNATAPSDTLVLNLSEDAYQGDAQFVVTVDGKQVGGTQTVTALHSAQDSQNFTFTGDFGSGSHVIGVNYINDAWGGTSATDRNLYVNSITFDGTKTTENFRQIQSGMKYYTVLAGATASASSAMANTVEADTATAAALPSATDQAKAIGANETAEPTYSQNLMENATNSLSDTSSTETSPFALNNLASSSAAISTLSNASDLTRAFSDAVILAPGVFSNSDRIGRTYGDPASLSLDVSSSVGSYHQSSHEWSR